MKFRNCDFTLALPLAEGEAGIANYIDIPDSVESLDGLERLLCRSSVDDELSLGIEQCPDPVGESTLEADAETALYDTLLQIFSPSDIQNLHVLP